MSADNHFITVSRKGDLMARRKGCPPVCVATATSGLMVEAGASARERGAPAELCVRFAHGGGNRMMRVISIESGGTAWSADELLLRFGVTERDLGQWIRAAVERALDRG